ncbi:hypothetical protein [Lutimonas sp.]|uniref:hypothetical protein n=1 Tax=Lutimonas sp. TaxID=1872403 RepID=UPI003D9B0E6A
MIRSDIINPVKLYVPNLEQASLNASDQDASCFEFNNGKLLVGRGLKIYLRV